MNRPFPAVSGYALIGKSCIVATVLFQRSVACEIPQTNARSRSQSVTPQRSSLDRETEGDIRWTGGGESGRWLDPANWDSGVPGPHDRVLFENTNSEQPIAIDGHVEIGHLRVQLSDKSDRLTLGGGGTLALNGWETPIPKKYSTALIVTGILDIGPDLTVDIRHQRFIAGNRDATIVIRSNKVRAGKQAPTSHDYHSDGAGLKLGITDRGRIVLAAQTWEPGMSLDLSAGHTEGPKAIEFARKKGSQGMTFTALKEHDGDLLEIRGFDEGDFIRFREDPRRSCDQGKELRIDAVKFPGWSDNGAAMVEEHDGWWYLKPRGTPPSKSFPRADWRLPRP